MVEDQEENMSKRHDRKNADQTVKRVQGKGSFHPERSFNVARESKISGGTTKDFILDPDAVKLGAYQDSDKRGGTALEDRTETVRF